MLSPPKPEATRFGTWNVGTLTGRSGEIAEVLERRRVKVCCIQETWWKGDGARVIRTATGEKYKLLWKGCAEGLNGVGVIIAEEFIDKVVKVVRVYDRLIIGKGFSGTMSCEHCLSLCTSGWQESG